MRGDSSLNWGTKMEVREKDNMQGQQQSQACECLWLVKGRDIRGCGGCW